jgi:hypothetical protein
MDRALIEEYRGIEIYFDLENETFYATIDDPENKWNRPKQSYKAVKKTIDDYLKENNDFKPFTALFRITYGGKKYEIRRITGIRKDAQFVYLDEKGVQHQLSKYDEQKHLIDSPENIDILAKLDEYEAEADAIRAKKHDLEGKLVSLNLKEIKAKYIQ